MRNIYLYVSGKIPYYTMPPIRDEGELSEAKIVTKFAKEFNIDEVYNSESSFIGSLKSADDFNPVEVPSSGPLKFNEKMLEVCHSSQFCEFNVPCCFKCIYTRCSTCFSFFL